MVIGMSIPVVGSACSDVIGEPHSPMFFVVQIQSHKSSLATHLWIGKMAFGLTAAAVAEFAAKPFIQKALKNPLVPQSVLSFYFVSKEGRQPRLKMTTLSLTLVTFCMCRRCGLSIGC